MAFDTATSSDTGISDVDQMPDQQLNLPLTITQLSRHYCTRKLQRTRKALKLTHGRGKFQAKKLEIETVTDSK